MAWEQPLWRLTGHEAGEDLSGAQHTFVKISAEGAIVKCAATTDVPVGVLQNAPTVGESAEIMVIGVTKMVASDVVLVDALVGTDAVGKAITIDPKADTNAYICGRALEAAGAADEIVAVLINCCVPVHNAKSVIV